MKTIKEQRQNTGRRKVRSPDFVTGRDGDIDNDRWITMRELVIGDGVSI
jgi:hypothetical protein